MRTLQDTMKQTDNVVIGNNIARLRKKAELSVMEAAQQLGVGRTYWYQIERGAANLAFDKLKRIAEMFDVDVPDLFREAKAKRKDPNAHLGSVEPQRKRKAS